MIIITVILIIILIFLVFKLWRSGLVRFGKHRHNYSTPDIPLNTHGSEFAANYETNFGPQYENVSGPASHTNNTIAVDDMFPKALIDSRYEVRELEEQEEEEQEQGSIHNDQDENDIGWRISENGTEEDETRSLASTDGQGPDSQNEGGSAAFSTEETSEI
ncbi:uncharacterized protein LOC135502054 [Lineus longissimus]|uniref:uncharacterized protein LOC135502054 n=1 Tax=Lineus longissimus TaxID=88925 RepID=UPI002B4E8B6A